nr:hypothetical protein [Angustibacter aerolatus]
MQMYKVKAAYNDGLASRYQAAKTRLAKFEEAGPPQEVPQEQQVKMRLTGGRTGKRAVVAERLEPDRADASVRPRGVVRRAGGGARGERLGQVALPAAAGGRRFRPGRRAPAGRRRRDRAGAARRHGAPRCAGAAGVVRADPPAPCAAGPHAAGDPAPGRRAPRRHAARAGGPRPRPLRAWPGRASRSSSR